MTKTFDDRFLEKLGIPSWPEADNWRKRKKTMTYNDENTNWQDNYNTGAEQYGASNVDGFGNEFRHYDENPVDDPFVSAGEPAEEIELTSDEVDRRINIINDLLEAAKEYLTFGTYEDMVRMLTTRL